MRPSPRSYSIRGNVPQPYARPLFKYGNRTFNVSPNYRPLAYEGKYVCYEVTDGYTRRIATFDNKFEAMAYVRQNLAWL